MNDAKNSWLIVFAAIVFVTGALMIVMIFLVIVMMFTVIMTVAMAVAMPMVLMIVVALLLGAVKPKLGRCISNHTLQTANTSQNISKIILDVRIYGQ